MKTNKEFQDNHDLIKSFHKLHTLILTPGVLCLDEKWEELKRIAKEIEKFNR